MKLASRDTQIIKGTNKGAKHWGEEISKDYKRYTDKHLPNTYLRITCRGVGLETNPRHVYDLFINVAVNMHKALMSDYRRNV